MICMQHVQYNAPNRMHVFQNFSGGDTPDPLLVLWPRTCPPPLTSKILVACMPTGVITDNYGNQSPMEIDCLLSMYAQVWLTDLEIFSSIVAALIHDYEHTGTTNTFHVNTG